MKGNSIFKFLRNLCISIYTICFLVIFTLDLIRDFNNQVLFGEMLPILNIMLLASVLIGLFTIITRIKSKFYLFFSVLNLAFFIYFSISIPKDISGLYGVVISVVGLVPQVYRPSVAKF